ncbi:MAG: LysM peptidoglycan-binding domain-containing protein [Rickettsiales bacterium]|jgi:hypothetical protein|nr:LysM peptidoglycan-binding domain-containing protein [Rickettsiales bacterium]
MPRKNAKNAAIGKTKKSTDHIIDDAVLRQNSWMSRRTAWARRFLGLDKRKQKARDNKMFTEKTPARKKSILAAYWFPILCALAVIIVALWVAFSWTLRGRTIIVPNVPEPVVNVLDEKSAPSFDIVRIEKGGNIVVAGRWAPDSNVSVLINKKLVATMLTNARGEFVYVPSKPFAAGNYTISLVGVESDIESKDKVFIYVSPKGYENSISLLMTAGGSTLLQAPKLVDGDLAVSKIDYLESGRIVVSGAAMPRLRVSLSLNGKYLGFARVSDHRNFGLGADVEKLEPGKEYKLSIRLHDGDGLTVAQVSHKFVMPAATGADDTFYTVRRDDCLWIIARNFLRKGILFSIIAEKNNIKNPNLIFPKQVLQIPVGK